MTEQKFVSLLLCERDSLNDEQIDNIKQRYILEGFEKVKEIVEKNKITPFAANLLRSIGCDENLWDKILDDVELRNQHILNFLEELFALFNKNSIMNVALIENFASLLMSGISISNFYSGDVDLTANIEDKDEIEKILALFGFVRDIRRNDVSSKMTNYCNEIFYNNVSFWVNIMWQPIARRILLDQRLITKRLRSSRENSIIVPSSKNIRTLEINSLMYFCIIHISSSHFYTLTPGIRLYTDVDRLARHSNIDWKLINKWATEDKLGIRTDMVLALSKVTLFTPISEEAFTNSFETKYFNKLFEFLYCRKKQEFKKHNSKIHRFYTEFISDNKSLFNSLLHRLLNRKG